MSIFLRRRAMLLNMKNFPKETIKQIVEAWKEQDLEGFLTAEERELLIKAIEYVNWTEADSPKGETVQGTRHEELSGSEALFGFVGWITTRTKFAVASRVHEVPPWIELINLFCDTNNLRDPREDWDKLLTHPKEE